MSDAGAPGSGLPGGWRSSRWLSQEFAELLADATKWREAPDAEAAAFDVIVVGSGYGGAVAAAELAGSRDGDRSVSVCVLERGREYLPGAFPSRMSDLPRQLRGSFAGHVRGGEGLFDLRTGGDVNVVIANGLGGGSLINAGVMEVPADEVLECFWPAGEAGARTRQAYFRRAKHLLGASRPQDASPDAPDCDNTIVDHADQRDRPLLKFDLLRRLAPDQAAFRPAALTIAMREGHTTSGGVRLAACRLCGDCATGCNHGAKESLDTNLLVSARRRGARIYCGATVLRVQRSQRRPDLWSVLVTHTDPQLRAREGPPRWIAARKLILAAGALGSTEILLRSQRAQAGPACSLLLGQRFSTNGDLLVFGYDYRSADGGDDAAGSANAIADENVVPGMRHVGPTITGVLDPQRARCSEDRPSQRLLIEEMAVPGPLRRMTEEMIATAATLYALDSRDATPHREGHPANDPCAVDPRRIARTSVFAVMGDDGADGELKLPLDDNGRSGDGRLDIVWPQLRKLDLFDVQTEYLRRRVGAGRLEGRTIPNPMWRLVPEKVEEMTGIQRGPLLTVHPLGGCVIGTCAADGVVDQCGRVFDAGGAAAGASSPVHEGLVVLDGAIVPRALCANPALTITALALRAVEILRRDWGFVAAETVPPPEAAERPVLRSRAEIDAEVRTHAARPATQTSISERLAGAVDLKDRAGATRRCWVELTLNYDPFTLPDLFRPDAQGQLRNAQLHVTAANDRTRPPAGRLRIFLLEEWERIRDLPQDETRWRMEDAAARSYAVSGTLTVLEREASSGCGRTLRAGWAWLRNRGLRDGWQTLEKDGWRALLKGGSLLEDARRLASQAGAVRLFRYALTIGHALSGPAAASSARRYEPPKRFETLPIEGRKRITYARPSNPWRQLQELQLSRLADALYPDHKPILELDQQYLAARSQPLLRLESQRDHFEALVDLASLAMTLFRALLPIHLWNTRKPDLPRPRLPARLPGRLPGLPDPEIHEVEVDRRNGAAVLARLTRYRGADCKADEPPVMLIHGYSAGGTTFAHPSLEPGLARYLAQQGRDVWVADLRSSCGMPGAAEPWTFERIALTDIPALVERVCRASGHAQLDIVAHCMGAAMLSMAVLSADRAAHGDGILGARDSDFLDHFRAARRELPRRIRRLVLSQVGPVVVLTQRNIFRAFVMSFAEQFLGPLRYRFRPEPGQGAAYDLLDRLLASVPYNDAELRRESPWQPWRKTRYTGTRHRMDALYGCTFSLENLDAEVLDHIDDFFGPVSIDTLAQVIHFARLRTLTNRVGRNRFVSPRTMARLWTFPTMSIHGEDNGLSDIATLEHMERLMREAGCAFTPVRVPGRGHQDCLIGTGLAPLFARIAGFLHAAPPAVAVPPQVVLPLRAEVPWLGPALLPAAHGGYVLGIGADPGLGAPAALCIAAAIRTGGRWHRVDGAAMQIRQLRASPASDWFTEPLPSWARAPHIERLGVFLLYAMAPGSPELIAQTDAAAAVDAAFLRMDAADREAPEAQALPLGIVDLGWMHETAETPLRIALGSCQYPPGIFDGRPAYESWRRLSARCSDAGRRPQLMVLTGDQVYVDATAGLFDPGQLEDRYRKPYEHWLHSAPVRDVLRRMPLYTMLDDHEIDNDCEPIADDADDPSWRRNVRLRELGIDAFLRYQRGGAALPAWGATTVHGIDLFLLDSRTGRERRCAATAPTAAMFEPAQLAALETWLDRAATHDRPKLIVSPAALLPRHRNAVTEADGDYADRVSLRSDGWDGYPASWHKLLRMVTDADVRSLIFLSGDEHLGLWVTARLQRIRATVVDRDLSLHSIHTAGLYTPYRFANARRAELLLTDNFEFGRQADGTYYRCELQTRVFEGAGFTFVSLIAAAGGQPWRLRCEYDDGTGAADRCEEVPLAQRLDHAPGMAPAAGDSQTA